MHRLRQLLYAFPFDRCAGARQGLSYSYCSKARFLRPVYWDGKWLGFGGGLLLPSPSLCSIECGGSPRQSFEKSMGDQLQLHRFEANIPMMLESRNKAREPAIPPWSPGPLGAEKVHGAKSRSERASALGRKDPLSSAR